MTMLLRRVFSAPASLDDAVLASVDYGIENIGHSTDNVILSSPLADKPEETSPEETSLEETSPKPILKRSPSLPVHVGMKDSTSPRKVNFSQNIQVAAALDKGPRYRCKYQVCTEASVYLSH